MANKDDVKRLVERLRTQGFEVELGRRCGHWKVRNPATGRKVTISQSPSDRRTLLNDISRLKKIGYAR